MSDTPTWPRKTRELQTRISDSTIWNDFHYRNDDIVIATYPKAGTTWMQQIVAQLLFGGDPNLEVQSMSPWLDVRLPPKAEKLALLEAQTHRRFVKTHLPADALVLSPRARSIHVARDGRDVVWSYFNHVANLTQPFLDRLNNLPGIDAPPMVTGMRHRCPGSEWASCDRSQDAVRALPFIRRCSNDCYYFRPVQKLR